MTAKNKKKLNYPVTKKKHLMWKGDLLGIKKYIN